MCAITYRYVSHSAFFIKCRQKEMIIHCGKQYRSAGDVPEQQGYDEISGDEGSLKQ
jgi:hypothetical protein